MLSKYSVKDLQVANSLPRGSYTMSVHVDLGSTETRGIVYIGDIDSIPEEDVVPSTYSIGEYDEDYSDIVVIDPQLRDCMEIHIRNTEQPMFSVLKGSLALQAGDKSKVSSSVSKIAQQATHANLHSIIVMEMLKNIASSGYNIPEDQNIDVKLTVALPPEDTDKARSQSVKRELSGMFEAKLPRLGGKKLVYTIREEDILLVSECNAVATYYGIMVDSSIADNEENAIVFEGGGRSSSIGIIKEGILISRLNVNSNDISGTKLRDKVNQIISETRKGTRIPDSQAGKALCTGKYKSGIQEVDASKDVIKAKSQYAENCVSFMLSALEVAGLQASEIQRVIYSGRMFSNTEDDKGAEIIPSLADFVTVQFQKEAGIEVQGEKINKLYPIPTGLVLYRLGQSED